MIGRTTNFRDELLADLVDPQEAAHYLNAALEDSDEMFLVALRDVAEATEGSSVTPFSGPEFPERNDRPR